MSNENVVDKKIGEKIADTKIAAEKITEKIDEKVISAADMVMRVFSNFEKADFEESAKLFRTWKNVVTNVKSQEQDYGEKLAAHTSPVDLKNGILLVEADHSGWIQILHLYSNFIVKGLRRALPELGISSLAFRLQNSGAELYGKIYEKQLAEERQKMAQKIDAEEKAVTAHFAKSGTAAENETRKIDATKLIEKNATKNSCTSNEKNAPDKTVGDALPPDLQAKFDFMKRNAPSPDAKGDSSRCKRE